MSLVAGRAGPTDRSSSMPSSDCSGSLRVFHGFPSTFCSASRRRTASAFSAGVSGSSAIMANAVANAGGVLIVEPLLLAEFEADSVSEPAPVAGE